MQTTRVPKSRDIKHTEGFLLRRLNGQGEAGREEEEVSLNAAQLCTGECLSIAGTPDCTTCTDLDAQSPRDKNTIARELQQASHVYLLCEEGIGVVPFKDRKRVTQGRGLNDKTRKLRTL